MIIEILRNIPADWFLHPLATAYAYVILRRLFSLKWTLVQLLLLSFAKEFYDLVHTTGWSWRDLAMNGVGLIGIMVLIRLWKGIENRFNHIKIQSK